MSSARPAAPWPFALVAGAIAAGVLVAGCDRQEATAPPDPRLLHFSDLDGVARRFLLEVSEFGPGLTAAGAAAEEHFAGVLAEVRAADSRRVAGAFDYDLPALVRYVFAPPLPLDLDLAWLRQTDQVPFDGVAAFVRGEAAAPVARTGGSYDHDPLGLRRFALTSRLERDLCVPARATAADIAAAFASINAFLDEENGRLAAHAEPPGGHFIDWFLKTTAMSGLAPKVGLVTDQLLGKLDDIAPGSLHRVLVVGPGIDLASPHLGVLAPVATYQPFELEDSLRRLKLAAPDLVVDALDLNPKVVALLDHARTEAKAGKPMPICLFRGVSKGRLDRPGVKEYLDGLFASFIDEPGFARSVEHAALSPDIALRAAAEIRGHFPQAFARPEGPTATEIAELTPLLDRIEFEARVAWREYDLPPAAVLRVEPIEADVVTDRFGAPDRYDLVLCTNVLVYFPPQLRALALLNLRRVTRAGGWLLCTDALASKEGEVVCGWRCHSSVTYSDWDPQYSYRCVKPR